MNVDDDGEIAPAIDSAIKAVENVFKQLPDPTEYSDEELAYANRMKRPQL
jgi:hypothetical protein